MTRINDLTRIHDGLMAAVEAIRPYTPGSVEYTVKSERGDPLTAADEAADVALKNALLREGEGGCLRRRWTALTVLISGGSGWSTP